MKLISSFYLSAFICFFTTALRYRAQANIAHAGLLLLFRLGMHASVYDNYTIFDPLLGIVVIFYQVVISTFRDFRLLLLFLVTRVIAVRY